MDVIPAPITSACKKDPRWQPYFVRCVFNGEYYLNLNCEMEPFTGPNGQKVRQAFNYAIDKDRIVQVSNDRYIAADGRGAAQHAGLPARGSRAIPTTRKRRKNSSRRPATSTTPNDPLVLWISQRDAAAAFASPR